MPSLSLKQRQPLSARPSCRPTPWPLPTAASSSTVSCTHPHTHVAPLRCVQCSPSLLRCVSVPATDLPQSRNRRGLMAYGDEERCKAKRKVPMLVAASIMSRSPRMRSTTSSWNRARRRLGASWKVAEEERESFLNHAATQMKKRKNRETPNSSVALHRRLEASAWAAGAYGAHLGFVSSRKCVKAAVSTSPPAATRTYRDRQGKQCRVCHVQRAAISLARSTRECVTHVAPARRPAGTCSDHLRFPQLFAGVHNPTFSALSPAPTSTP